MKNPFSWGKAEQGSAKDYFSTSFFFSRPESPVTEIQALSIPAVKAAVELISNSVSQLPVHLYVEDESNESVTKVENDPRVARLNHTANNYETAQVIKKKIVMDYLLRGKAYLYQKEDGSIYVLPAVNIVENSYTTDYISIEKKTYQYNGMETIWLDDTQVFEVNSGTNGILFDNSQLIQMAISQMDFNQSLLQNGALPTGVLKAASRLSEKAIGTLRTSFDSLYKGEKKSGKTLILEEGLEYQQLSLNPDQMQLTESRKNVVSEVARIFNLPESLINSYANKYAALEQNNIQFLQTTLSPIITNIESYFDQHLLNDEEKALGYYFRFKTDEILRTTEKEKIENIEAAFKGSLLSFNEARHKLDLPRTEKDFYTLSIGQVVKYEDGSLVNLNTLGQPTNTNQEVKSNNEDGTKNNEPGIIEI